MHSFLNGLTRGRGPFGWARNSRIIIIFVIRRIGVDIWGTREAILFLQRLLLCYSCHVGKDHTCLHVFMSLPFNGRRVLRKRSLLLG